MFDPVSQAEALATSPLAAGEAAQFFVAPRLGGVDCLRATYVTHAYAPHTHDTFVIGTIERGCEAWSLRGAKHYAGPGDLVFVNPLEVHDGSPHDGGYSYRTTYPAVTTLQAIARSLNERQRGGTPHFPEARVHDPLAAGLLAGAHRATEIGVDALEAEERLNRAYAAILIRHAGFAPAAIGAEPRGVGRVRALIEAEHAGDLALERLAAEAELSVNHLIRAFRRTVGLTPHAYLVDVRVRRAKERLKAGEGPAEVAAAVGFADQAHLTRAFKARGGVGPGAYRRAAQG